MRRRTIRGPSPGGRPIGIGAVEEVRAEHACCRREHDHRIEGQQHLEDPCEPGVDPERLARNAREGDRVEYLAVCPIRLADSNTIWLAARTTMACTIAIQVMRSRSICPALRVPRTAELTILPARANLASRSAAMNRRNGNTKNSTCHQLRRRNAHVDGATIARRTNSATKTSHIAQPVTKKTSSSVDPSTARFSPITTSTNTSPSADAIGAKRSSSRSTHASRSAARARSDKIAPGIAMNMLCPTRRLVTPWAWPALLETGRRGEVVRVAGP
jgi:hypothetical protein